MTATDQRQQRRRRQAQLIKDWGPIDGAEPAQRVLKRLNALVPNGSMWVHVEQGFAAKVLGLSMYEETWEPAVTYLHDGFAVTRRASAFLFRFNRSEVTV